MSYNHGDRIGNEGDVVKHALLARFVQEILKAKGNDTFIYAESHTGRALYTDLPQSGRWRYGIGPFSHILLNWKDDTGTRSPEEKYPNLMAYRDACFEKEVAPGGEYPGSSGMVSNILNRAGKPYRFMLWDVCASVCEDLRQYYKGFLSIAVNCGNGYDGLAAISEASLVLVDPVHVREEKEQILKTLRSLNDKAIPFLCWTALVKGKEEAYHDFKARTEKDFSVHWVQWKCKEGTTIGCQITVPKGTWEPIATATIGELSELMHLWIQLA